MPAAPCCRPCGCMPWPMPTRAWREAADASPMALDGFTAWVDEVLERSSFMPAGPGGAAQVFVTPLARAMLRPFAAVVCPGADDRHLGASAPPHPLLSDAEQLALGLPARVERRQRETLAFQHALALNRVTFLRRHVDANGELLADSPLLQRLALDLAAQGRTLADWADPRIHIDLDAAPVARPLPVAGGQLPGRVSASAVQALRDCPYRFFSRHVLGLREDDELEAEIEKRDYGTWLHAVLHRFHLTREAPGTAQAERVRLHELALAVQAGMGLADDEFLPFSAAFDGVAARYVAWLHERDAAGARWQDGERDCRSRPEALQGVELQGVIDRIDRVEHGTAVQLIDYKTVKADKLKRQVREPLEDTQLAFYAALLSAETDGPLAGLLPCAGRRRACRRGAACGRAAQCRGDGARARRRVRAPACRCAAACTRRGADLRTLRSARPVPPRPLAGRAGRMSAQGRPITGSPAYRADGAAVTREAFYALACDPRRSVVVEACAGAGKTWMLVSRIVRALLDGAQPQEILAITFTRKAAGEMRERLDDWLQSFASPAMTAAQRARELRDRGVPAGQAEQLAETLAGLQRRLLDAGRAVEVRTFHAWFAQLLRAAPYELLDEIGIDPEGELLQDLDDHRSEVMRRFHAALLREPARRADHATLIAQRGRSQAAKWLDAVLARRVELELADRAGVLDEGVAPAVPEGAPPPQADVSEFGLARRLAAARGSAVVRRQEGARRRLCARAGARPGRPAAALRGSLVGALHQGRCTTQARRSRRARCHAACPGSHRRARAPARVAPRARTAGAAVAGAARRVCRVQARARADRHERPRAWRAGAAARRLLVGLGAGAAGCAHPPCADRRVPGHQPAAMACAARLAGRLCRRRRRGQRAARAGAVRRRRPEAEHLPLPPRRAEGLRRGARVRRRGVGRLRARV